MHACMPALIHRLVPSGAVICISIYSTTTEIVLNNPTSSSLPNPASSAHDYMTERGGENTKVEENKYILFSEMKAP